MLLNVAQEQSVHVCNLLLGGDVTKLSSLNPGFRSLFTLIPSVIGSFILLTSPFRLQALFFYIQ